MNGKVWISATLLALSSAAIAQVTTAPEPKLGNAQDVSAADNAAAETGATDNAAGSADNATGHASDPGKR